MKGLKKNAILHNRYVLYLVFIIALGNLLSLGYARDYYSVSIFVLIGFITSFFSKNMIVILFIAVALSNIIKYGAKAGVEGMTDEAEVGTESAKKSAKKSESESESLSVETTEGSNKEKFGQDKNVIYTSDEDMEMAKTEKMILSQEKILKSMNKYKPLLDTLQGITKNMAIVKGASSVSDE
jgi:uncharacterized membrane protein